MHQINIHNFIILYYTIYKCVCIYIYTYTIIFLSLNIVYIYIYWYHHDNRNHDDDDGDDDDDDPMGQQSTSNLKVSQSDLGPTAGAAQSLQGCRAPSPEPWLDKRKIKVSTPMCCCLLVAYIQADIGRADQKSDCWLLLGWCSTIAGFFRFLIWGFPDTWDQSSIFSCDFPPKKASIWG